MQTSVIFYVCKIEKNRKKSATATWQYKDQKGNQQFFELWAILQFATTGNQVCVHPWSFQQL